MDIVKNSSVFRESVGFLMPSQDIPQSQAIEDYCEAHREAITNWLAPVHLEYDFFLDFMLIANAAKVAAEDDGKKETEQTQFPQQYAAHKRRGLLNLLQELSPINGAYFDRYRAFLENDCLSDFLEERMSLEAMVERVVAGAVLANMRPSDFFRVLNLIDLVTHNFDDRTKPLIREKSLAMYQISDELSLIDYGERSFWEDKGMDNRSIEKYLAYEHARLVSGKGDFCHFKRIVRRIREVFSSRMSVHELNAYQSFVECEAHTLGGVPLRRSAYITWCVETAKLSSEFVRRAVCLRYAYLVRFKETKVIHDTGVKSLPLAARHTWLHRTSTAAFEGIKMASNHLIDVDTMTRAGFFPRSGLGLSSEAISGFCMEWGSHALVSARAEGSDATLKKRFLKTLTMLECKLQQKSSAEFLSYERMGVISNSFRSDLTTLWRTDKAFALAHKERVTNLIAHLKGVVEGFKMSHQYVETVKSQSTLEDADDMLKRLERVEQFLAIAPKIISRESSLHNADAVVFAFDDVVPHHSTTALPTSHVRRPMHLSGTTCYTDADLNVVSRRLHSGVTVRPLKELETWIRGGAKKASQRAAQIAGSPNRLKYKMTASALERTVKSRGIKAIFLVGAVFALAVFARNRFSKR